MINNFVQPKIIVVADDLQLVKYYPRYFQTLAWYQDLDVCKQVDNIDFPYDIARLKGMYSTLSKGGECYYVKVKDGGRWHLVGDISLYKGDVSIVICKEFQNRHIGRRAVSALLERAKQIGFDKVECEIYDFNAQSKKMFESVGFFNYAPQRYRINL